MKDELLVRKEKWEVVVYVNALIDEVFTGSFKFFERFFDLLFLCKNFFSWAVTLGCSFAMRMRNCHLNTGLQLSLNIWPILVFDPPLMSHACAF